MLLTQAQEQWLWQETVSNSGLLSVAATAEECRKAWGLVHQWRIGKAPGNEDAQAFSAWSLKYKDSTKGEVDAARLPDLVVGFLKAMKLPRVLVAYGFDILPQQTKEFFDACAAAGVEAVQCQPPKKAGSAKRVLFNSKNEELEAAAVWARARLEENRYPSSIFPRIGVVVPDLEQRRREVQRVFSRVMQPGHQLPGAAPAAMPFNISIGIPLVQYPVVALALSLIELSLHDLPFPEISKIVLSPFIGGAQSEMAARAKLDVQLRRRLGATVSLAKLIANMDGTPLLRVSLEKLFNLRETKSQSPSEWARHFSALLEAASFPGDRTLDSAEFQARAKWHEVLGELSRLERLSSKIFFLQALSTLKRIAAETLFQPESGDAPVQVLGVLESAGIEFDHLWVSGLTDEAWPIAARANPFIPIALQKKAGIPQASAEESLALDRRITEGWRGAAQEAVFSHYDKDEDRRLAASPLILDIAEAAVAVSALPRFRDLVFASRKISTIEDSVGPAVTAKKVKGGTRVLSDQSACPFRAFARHRLAAEQLEQPVGGLDASDRGVLLHKLMSSLWGSLKSSSSLQGNLAPAIDAAAAAAVKELKLDGKFAEIERARLARLAREWLEIEKTRKEFEVVAVEKPIDFIVAGIAYHGRIDRLDRLKDGGHVLIDYKTGRNPTPKHWDPPRPHDPQLPLYAVSTTEEISAAAFAKVRPGEMRFMGYSRNDKIIPGVKKYNAWEQLNKEWKTEAESLGKGFASGDARVDPKLGFTTCRDCALQTLCRVYEKVSPLPELDSSDNDQ